MTDAARQAYNKLAPGYDELTGANDYEQWLGKVLLPEIERRGLSHGRVLDAGCGTGRAFEPLSRRGWDIFGCDISSGMLQEARRKFPKVPTLRADLRDLPVLGAFDLIIVLNDVVNYLTEDGDLERALAGLAANLAPEGLLLFDSNTISSFREKFSHEARTGIYELPVTGTVVEEAGVEPHTHHQRHFALGHLEIAINEAALELLAVLGQREKEGTILLSENVDEGRDEKAIFIARRL
jgi:SAM-dependent methyltransferase